MVSFTTGLRRGLVLGAAVALSTTLLVSCSGNTPSDGGSAGAATGDVAAAGKPIKIAMSNFFNGNIWRKQMEASAEATVKANPDVFSDYKTVESDGSAPQQAQQIQSLVLEGYKAIIVEAASPTALNGAIEQACQAGVTVVVFDSLATADCAYKVAFDYVTYGELEAQFLAKQLNGKGNILMVRGVAGNTVDKDIYQGVQNVLKKYPDMKLVGEVYGQWTESTSQQEVAKILPSLPKIDGVLTEGNDGGGALDAFVQAGVKPLPIVIQGNTGQDLQSWQKVSKADPGYKTMSISSQPSISSAALWMASMIINKQNDAAKVPDKTIYAPLLVIPEENRDPWAEYLDYTQIAENPTTLKMTQTYVQSALDGNPIKVEQPLPPTK